MLVFLVAAMAAAPDVFIVSVDTLRADRLGCYGNPKPISPNIDAFAREAMQFEDCLAEVPLTSPSFGSMMTSRYPRMNGAARNGLPLPPNVPTLAEQFKSAGYQTACVTSNWTLKAALSGLDRGFDSYDDGFKKKRWGFIKSERDADEVLRLSLDVLAKRDPGKPLFGWFHFSDPHAPYNFRKEFDPDGIPIWKLDEVGQTRVSYDSEVAFTDSFVGKILRALPHDNVIVVFISDHGESLHEHGYIGHGRRIYQDNIHVPLLVKAPGLTPGKSKVPTRLIDVAPTLLSLAQLKPMPGMLGVDLITSPPGTSRPRVIETYGGAVPGVPGAKALMASRPPMRQGVVVGSWKLIVGGPEPELYEIKKDPGELKNLFHTEPGHVAELRKVLANWDKETPKGSADAADLSQEDVDALKSLGYVE